MSFVFGKLDFRIGKNRWNLICIAGTRRRIRRQSVGIGSNATEMSRIRTNRELCHRF